MSHPTPGKSRARVTVATSALVVAGLMVVIALLQFLAVVPWSVRGSAWAMTLAALGVAVHPSSRDWLDRVDVWMAGWRRRTWGLLLASACLVFVTSKLAQHWSLGTGSYDLGMFHHAVDNTLHGQFMLAFGLGRNFFSEHFSPVLLGWTAFYALVPRVETLLVLQGLTTALAAWPLYVLARRCGLGQPESAIVALAFLLNPFLWRGFVFDVHMEMMLPLFVFGVVASAMGRRWVAFYVFALLALTIKEDVPLVLAACALWLVVRRRESWRHAAALALLSAVWFVVATKVAIPAAMGDGSAQSRFLVERYGHLGNTLGAIVWKMLAEPWRLWEMLTGRPVRALVGVLGPAAWVEPVALVGAIPSLLVSRATDYRVQNELALYYGLPTTVVIFVAVPATLVRLREKWGRLVSVVCALGMNVPATGDVAPRPISWPTSADLGARRAIGAIPAGARVTAQTPAVPQLPVSAAVELFPQSELGEWLVLLPRKVPWPARKADIVAALRRALEEGYGAEFVNESVVILRRGSPGPFNEQALQEAEAASSMGR